MSTADSNFIIGTSDFDEIIEKHAAVIDKSLFIRDFMNSGVKVDVDFTPLPTKCEAKHGENGSSGPYYRRRNGYCVN